MLGLRLVASCILRLSKKIIQQISSKKGHPCMQRLFHKKIFHQPFQRKNLVQGPYRTENKQFQTLSKQLAKIYFQSLQNYYKPNTILMKYLVCLAAISLSVVSQEPISQELPVISDINFVNPAIMNDLKEMNQNLQSKENLHIDSEWKTIENSHHEAQKDFSKEQRPRKQHKDHANRQAHHRQFSDQNQKAKNHHPRETRQRDSFDDSQIQNFQRPNQMDEEDDQNMQRQRGHGEKSHKRHGKPIGHIVFLVILAALSFLLVRKCIKKRKNCQRRRISENQMINDPATIDEEINKHYAEIQRLSQIKNVLNQRAQSQPIIYQHIYPQQAQMANLSNGRLVNENYMGRSPSQVLYPQIPVGRPVNNHGSQQFYFRSNDY